MFFNSCAMRLCWVTLVHLPLVCGVLKGKVVHVIITISLGQNASRSNRQVLGIAFNDGFVGKSSIRFKAVSVHNNGLRTKFQPIKGAVHSQYASVKYVYFVDFIGRNLTHSPSQRVSFYLRAQCVTQLLG